MCAVTLVREQPEPLAEWLESSLHDIAGRDPLGLNTISLDRILPQLLPGILQLSERARYFSIYPWMLWQFADRKRPATTDEIDRFIRRREFELCLAMRLCKHCNGDGAIGANRADPRINSGEDPFQRGLSVDTPKGGFGLYYRSPLSDLHAVARVGTPLGPEEIPTPVEVLYRSDPRVVELAESFHESIKDTTYYEHYERSDDPIPRAVIEELAEAACLCRLPYREREQQAIRTLIFQPANDHPDAVAACDARRRAFAMFLSLLDEDPQVAGDTGRFWQRLIERFESHPTADQVLARTVAPWSALAMKECVQEGLCSIWTDFCRTGIERQRHDGLSRNELSEMIRGLLANQGLDVVGTEIEVSPDEPVLTALDRIAAATDHLDWNALRKWTVAANTAVSGLILLLILIKRIPDPARVHPLWGEIAARRSEHQDGLLGIAMLTRRHIKANPTLEEVLAWLIQHFIIGPHEVIAYSKLPEATFRFSWEESGRLRFFNPGGSGLGRFAPSDDRRGVMATLSEDLGYWTRHSEDVARLTADGHEFIATVTR